MSASAIERIIAPSAPRVGTTAATRSESMLPLLSQEDSRCTDDEDEHRWQLGAHTPTQ